MDVSLTSAPGSRFATGMTETCPCSLRAYKRIVHPPPSPSSWPWQPGRSARLFRPRPASLHSLYLSPPRVGTCAYSGTSWIWSISRTPHTCTSSQTSDSCWCAVAAHSGWQSPLRTGKMNRKSIQVFCFRKTKSKQSLNNNNNNLLDHNWTVSLPCGCSCEPRALSSWGTVCHTRRRWSPSRGHSSRACSLYCWRRIWGCSSCRESAFRFLPRVSQASVLEIRSTNKLFFINDCR